MTSRAAKPEAPAPPAPPSRDRWLLSYADFLTLLLALFVVLYASARLDAEKNRGLFEGLQSSFALEGTTTGEPDPGAPERPERVTGATRAIPLLDHLAARVEERLEREREQTSRDPGISVRSTERGLVISLAASEYFPAGGAQLAPDRRRTLAAIAPLLAAERGSLLFEGHTDDRPVRSAAFPSNWELSSARAAAVARYFIDEHAVDPGRIATTGYAAYRPIAGSGSPTDRARNRRVEIVVLADGELVPASDREDEEQALGRLLERLPAIEGEADESLRPSAPGPAPFDIPLP